MKTDRKAIARFNEAVRESRKSESTKRRTAESESSSGSVGSPKPNGNLKMRFLARKKEK